VAAEVTPFLVALRPEESGVSVQLGEFPSGMKCMANKSIPNKSKINHPKIRARSGPNPAESEGAIK